MAEQTGKQEQRQEAKAERPQVRRVRLAEPVIFPGAPLLGGSDAKTEVDAEGRVALQRRAVVTLTAYGPMVAYQADTRPSPGSPTPGLERAAMVIPWRLVKGVDVAPEWKP